MLSLDSFAAGVVSEIALLADFFILRHRQEAQTEPPNRGKAKQSVSRKGVARPRLMRRAAEETKMWDLSLILASIAFFAIAIAYIYACEKLR